MDSPGEHTVALGQRSSAGYTRAVSGTEHDGRDWFDSQFEESDEGPFTLHILTHGRVYKEEYETLEAALSAARAAWKEPREQPIAITDARGVICFDQAALEHALSS